MTDMARTRVYPCRSRFKFSDAIMRPSPRYSRLLSLAAMLAAMGAIFLADTLTDYAVAVAVFYTLVVLAAVRLLSRRAVLLLAGTCTALTGLSFWLTPTGAFELGLVNAGISIVAILTTTALALKIEAAKAAAHAAQLQIQRITRVTTLGELTASIAHEVNQPLAAIVTSGHACQRWLDQAPPNLAKARQALDRILGDANRASAVIARVRSLTRGDAPHRTGFDFNQAIEETVSFAQGEIERRGIALSFALDDRLPAAWADRVQIQQVIGNLLRNAMEAMEAVPRAQRRIAIASARLAPRAVEFTIADAGSGFAPGARDRLFDAFWSTKPGGIGLGLAISRTIIEANGGRLQAAPNPGGGALLRFSLPTREENRDAA